MLHQHMFHIYKRKWKLKILFVSDYFGYPNFSFCSFCIYLEKKFKITRFRRPWVGSQLTLLIFLSPYLLKPWVCQAAPPWGLPSPFPPPKLQCISVSNSSGCCKDFFHLQMVLSVPQTPACKYITEFIVMLLSFWTDRSKQTGKIQIRLLLQSLFVILPASFGPITL